ncbi:hypothetical protein [Niallia sp. 03133]|uniref:hypothetical protein n=1 Tax=Niallia sp. 03133 TaxID=3458060 RepID=UPI004044FECF
MAYLSQVRSNGYQYIYLTEYCRNSGYGMKLERHIFSFGNSKKVLGKMHGWLNDFEKSFPAELKEKGYTKEDLSGWIKTLETRRTGRGKIFKFDYAG